MNNALATLPERAMRVAHQVGDGLKDAVPDRAIKWMETGAAMAALKTGGRVATTFVRRNPAIAVTAAAGPVDPRLGRRGGDGLRQEKARENHASVSWLTAS